MQLALRPRARSAQICRQLIIPVINSLGTGASAFEAQNLRRFLVVVLELLDVRV